MNENLSESRESRLAGVERRHEMRKPVRGAGWLEPADGSLARQEFRLVDVSPSGFRVRHHCRTLEAGQSVRFRHEQAAGVAVVVWNRVLGHDVESGLVIVAGRE
jgi:hypothetical protein